MGGGGEKQVNRVRQVVVQIYGGAFFIEKETLTNGDFLNAYKFPLKKGNFYSVFRASPESAVSQNNP